MQTPRASRRLRQRARGAVRLASLVLIAVAGGACTSVPDAPRALVVPSDRYDAVFDAAVDTARDAGLPPLVRDRTAGVIETETRIAGSLLEPWLWGEESLAQATENTLLFQRRRARIEFSPEVPASARLRGADRPLPEPGVAGAAATPLDLRSDSGPLEVRVRVFVERAFVPNLNMSSYSRTLSTRYSTPLDPAEETWTPVGRDRAWEARILADLGRRMNLVAVAEDGRPSS
ncbi:MAG: hypothetical protein ACO3YY_00030 [Phycisphaerales bacterium]